MTIASTTKLAALLALLPASLASGCNAHPIKTVEYQTGGGIDVDEGGDESGGDGDDDSEEGGSEGEGKGAEGGDGADDGVDDGAGEPTCETTTIDIQANPPEVMLVLDKSSSMVDHSWNHGGESVRRWESLHGVTADILETYDASMNFGAVLFPAYDAGAPSTSNPEPGCRIATAADVATASGNASAILAAIPGATDFAQVQGATPARAGIELAAAELAAVQTQGTRAMILVTDGLANCADMNAPFLYDAQMPSAVAAAFAQQIPTYVVGIDIRDEHISYADANAQVELDAVARAGGVPASNAAGELAFYDASDEDALYDALDAIAARVECTVPLPATADEDAIVTIAVDGEAIDQIADCDVGDGWRFTDSTTRNAIELCNAACDALRVTGQVQTTACEPDNTLVPVP